MRTIAAIMIIYLVLITQICRLQCRSENWIGSGSI